MLSSQQWQNGDYRFMIGFTLWVLDGSAPPYQRATFADYASCVTAGRAEVDSLKSLSPSIAWQCVPDRSTDER
jgi:hypothetical protein